ncbi:hypothetical protein LS73_008190 [Helicobacter muridarum]|uniref:Phage-Barnase-EndoU-ColicinE5/D-RelE-like nuclease domain-containing protein n=1 Tax=Helicobacter muridarum TaxID=216 RepID=A0A377PTN5_9HELI|nr:PBECR2 nuclease fold domain-containing protein [Helicobacter muridarum]TLD98795.1 hypothetical protein LS73_008190 [Helicobacter muridarum]STQ85772.1 Uncharacterised protein [Helicobacter muridarum]
MSRFAGALSDNLAHQSLEHQLGLALRYARDTKDFINTSIESLSKNEFKDDSEAIKVLKEFNYWREKLNKDSINSIFALKEAYETETNTKAKDEIATAIAEYKPKLQEFQEIIDAEVIEHNKALGYDDNNAKTKQAYKSALENITPEEMPKALNAEEVLQILQHFDNVENLKQHLETRGDSVLRNRIFNLLETTLKEPHFKYKKDNKDKYLKRFKDGKGSFYYVLITKNNDKTFITHFKNTDLDYLTRELENADEILKGDDIIASLKRPTGASGNTTKEATLDNNSTTDSIKNNLIELKQDINEVESLLQQNPSKALEYKLQENYANSITQAGNLLSYVENMAKELANNPSQLKDLAKLKSGIKDYIKIPYSIIVDSKGNALPLTDSAIRAAILYYFFEELNRLSKRMLNKALEALPKPILNNDIKHLTYQAKATQKESMNAVYKKANDIEVNYKKIQGLLPAPEATQNKIDSNLFFERKTPLEAEVENNVEIFIDSSNIKHAIPKDIATKWKETFNLKSLQDDFIPNFSQEIKEALAKEGIQEIRLKGGSLLKLMNENRMKYLDRIKPTLQEPHRIIMQDENTIIFAKNFGEQKHFTSVARNDNNEWIIRSNAPKSENGLNNKIEKGGYEIYNKNQANSQINASTPYDDIANSNIKLDKEHYTTDSTKPQTQKQADLIESNMKGKAHERQESTRQTANKQGTTATTTKSIERDYRAGSEGLNNHTSDSSQGLQDTRGANKRDNEPSNADGFKSQEIPQEKPQDNARAEENIRAEPSNSSFDTKSSDDILREGEGHNARIGFKQDNNIGFNAGGNSNEYQTSPRFRSRNVSLTHKGKKAKDSNIESKQAKRFFANAQNDEALPHSEPKSHSEALAEESIPQEDTQQTTKDIIKEAKQQKLSVKETQKQINENKLKQQIQAIQDYGDKYLEYSDYKFLEDRLQNEKNVKALAIDFLDDSIHVVKKIEVANTKDNIPITMLHIKKLISNSKQLSSNKIIEPLTGLKVDKDMLAGFTSDRTKAQIMGYALNDVNREKIPYALQNGINTQHLSDFQKELLKEIIEKINNEGKKLDIQKAKLDSNIESKQDSKRFFANAQNDEALPHSEPKSHSESKSHSERSEESIPQEKPKPTKDIIKEAKEQGLSVKETQKLVDENNAKQGTLELNPKPLAKLGRNTSQLGNANLTKTTASESLAPIEKHLDDSTIRSHTKEKELKKLQGNLPRKDLDSKNKEKQEIKQPLSLDVEKIEKAKERLSKPLIQEYETTRKELKELKNTKPILRQALQELKEIMGEDKFNSLNNQGMFRKKLTFRDMENYNYWKEYIDNDEYQPFFTKYDAIFADNKAKTEVKEEQLDEIGYKIKSIEWDLWNVPQNLRTQWGLQQEGNNFIALRDMAHKHGYSDNQTFKAQIEQYKKQNANNPNMRSNDKLYEVLTQNIKEWRDNIEKKINTNPIKEFGTNYAEFYHDGQNAVKKPLAEKQGQVAGAFYRDELGDIDLVWGKVTNAEKNKGYGLAHIIDKHPNLDLKLMADIVEKGEIKETFSGANIYYDDYILGINKGWGENGVIYGDNKWIVTAFNKGENHHLSNLDDFKKGKDFTTKLKPNSTTKKLNKDVSLDAQHDARNKKHDKAEKVEQVEKEADNFQSSSNPAGLLNPEEKALIQKSFK